MQAIIGVDGSDGSWEAVRQAGAILSPEHDQVVLYYAPPRFQQRGELRPDQQLGPHAQERLTNDIFDQATALLPAGLRERAARVVDEQHARLGITAAADRYDVGLIAVGARGLSKMTDLLLGSVTRATIRSTSRPVLVARPPVRRHDDTPYHVLWAVNETPALAGPVESIRRFSWPAGATGRVIHVVRPSVGIEVPSWFEERVGHDKIFSAAWDAEFEADRQKKLAELTEYCAQLPAPFQCPPTVEVGEPAKTIIDTAEVERADLVIVTTREMNALQRFIVGSTADKLLQYATCSVLVLHPSA